MFFRVTDDIVERLRSTSRNSLEKEGIVPTQLCCKTVEAKQINENKLEQLTGIYMYS